MARPCVVVVEDEADLRDAVVEYFAAMGLGAHGATNGEELRRIISETHVDLVLLDIALPGEDGLSICRWLRRETACGIIMATGAGQPIDRVVGLEIGADDYVVKPYDLREMLARVRSVLRRTAGAAVPERVPVAEPAAPEFSPFGPYRLDLTGRRLLLPDGSVLALTAAEFALVEVFAAREGRPLSRGTIAQLTDGRDLGPEDRTIDIRIARLRRKLGALPGGEALIRTVRGEGYRFDAPRT